MTLRLYFLLLFGLAVAGCARQKYFQPDARISTTPTPGGADSVRVTAGRHYQRGPIHRLLLGAHYRKVWAQPISAPVLDLRTAVPGGLRAGKRGGGFQSISMTVLGPDGREYALRSLDKDPYKTLPKALRHTFLLNLVRDATSAGMPYGAFVVPPLALAAGLRQSNPRLFYVRADETGLGAESADFRGRVVMLEEKLEGEALPEPGGKTVELVETEDMLADIFAQPTSRIDQRTFVRARLLDLWLGDWDRHEGQWTWEKQRAGSQVRFIAVPKDRDQVFYRFGDGLLTWVASRPWAVAKLRTFKPRFESIAGYTRNTHFLDERALSELSRRDVQREARRLQGQLTDSVIARAVRRLPREVYALEGPRLTAALRSRRELLPRAADEFYRLYARHALVTGTDEAERFVVERLTDTTTVVSIYALTDEKQPPQAKDLHYRRVFHPSETSRIILHGLDGKDLFEVRGTVRRSPRIDIYGGPGEDTVQDISRVAGLSRKTRFYDTRRNNSILPGPETSDKTTHGVLSHAFDRDGSGR
ncbi:hypothetical protein LJY25_00570 [Hymenobacter sp. BT175]|uniref:hypothetical protein n=1 Tax=Hymenobacter translucens TaxID=2886507 RepID=UPI001D0DEC37|nr:hypothetical protein [Hymenobacter translucens]MCC2544921.1 hypothetical protein [Hymenobacter translucens]